MIIIALNSTVETGHLALPGQMGNVIAALKTNASPSFCDTPALEGGEVTSKR